MRKLSILAVAAALVAAAPLTAQDPAALLVRVDGSVQIQGADGSTATAAVGTRLVPGDQLVPSSGARAVLIMRTGAQQIVTSNTTVAAPSGGGDATMFNRAMSMLSQAASADARTAGGRQGMIRPIPGEPVIVAPRNGLTVTSTHPTFEWMAVDGAETYTVQLRKMDGSRPMRFEAGTSSSWTLPANEPGLDAGATYRWTVAPRPGRPTREQEFHVLEAEMAESLDERIGEISTLGLDPSGDGLFLSAMIYREMDLYYEARSALMGIEAQGAMSADLYLLKGEILNVLGHAEEAREAFDRADELMR